MLTHDTRVNTLIAAIDELIPGAFTPLATLYTTYLLLYACGKIGQSEINAFIEEASQGNMVFIAKFNEVIRAMDNIAA